MSKPTSTAVADAHRAVYRIRCGKIISPCLRIAVANRAQNVRQMRDSHDDCHTAAITP
jgi:hypothetical protein